VEGARVHGKDKLSKKDTQNYYYYLALCVYYLTEAVGGMTGRVWICICISVEVYCTLLYVKSNSEHSWASSLSKLAASSSFR
jgi:hypothetical protein